MKTRDKVVIGTIVRCKCDFCGHSWTRLASPREIREDEKIRKTMKEAFGGS